MNPTLSQASLQERLKLFRTPLGIFFLGLFFLGINQGIMQATFNNYLLDVHHLDAAERGFLEFPREFPGFAIALVTGLLAAFTVRSWAVIVGILSMIGVVGLGFASPTVILMTSWMFLWSLADHLFMPVESMVGIMSAKSGSLGKRLGQVAGMRNLAMIVGSGLVWLLMGRWVSLEYSSLFLIAGVAALVASIFFARARFGGDGAGNKRAFVVRREYSLYYWLNILFGGRKQIFLTFAPWLLISRYHVSASTIALLLIIASALGVGFRQVFGIVVDRFGERRVLAVDAVILLGICLGFAFSQNIWLLFALFIIDNLMFATRIARTSYLNRVLVDKRDMSATLSMGVTLDHAVSMTIPALGGLLWSHFGSSWVFLAAAGVALLMFVAALRIPSAGSAGAVSLEAS